MKLAISNIAWLPDQLDSALAEMQDNGATGLEIAPGLVFAQEPDAFAPSRSAISALTRKTEARGIDLISMQSLLYGVDDARLFGSPSERERFELGICRAIALAGLLGIPNLVLGAPRNRIVPDSLDEATVSKIAVDVFRRLGDQALRVGARLALEPNPAAYGTNFLNTIEDATRLALRIDHPAVTVNFDLGSLHMNSEISQFSELYAAAAPRVSHVHVSEPHLAPAPADPELFRQIAADLCLQGYGGWFSIEMRASVEDQLGVIKRSLLACAKALTEIGS